MNKKQIVILWVGIIIIVCMGLYPPHMDSADGYGGYYPTSYQFIFSEPSGRRKKDMVNVSQLFAHWFMIVVVTGGLLLTFKDKKKDKKQGGEE